MKTYLAMLVLLSACGPDAFTPFIPPTDGDADPSAMDGGNEAAARDADASAMDVLEASSDAGMDAPKEASCPYSGSSECQNVIDDFCTRYASCCQQFPGNGSCSTWGSNASQCKAHYQGAGFDCSSGKYVKAVCGNASACMSSINQASCSIVFQSVGPDSNNFTCGGFWGQF